MMNEKEFHSNNFLDLEVVLYSDLVVVVCNWSTKIIKLKLQTLYKLIYKFSQCFKQKHLFT